MRLRALIAAFDETALAALASKGILRRAQKAEAASVKISSICPTAFT